METPVVKVFLFQWGATTYCFDFSQHGAMQGPTPAVLSSPTVEYVTATGSPPAPEIGAPVVTSSDFYNAKGETPKKVDSGKGVAVRFTATQGVTVAGEYPVKCTVLADGDEPLTLAAVVVVSDNPT